MKLTVKFSGIGERDVSDHLFGLVPSAHLGPRTTIMATLDPGLGPAVYNVHHHTYEGLF